MAGGERLPLVVAPTIFPSRARTSGGSSSSSCCLTFGYRRGESLKIYVTDVNVRGRKPHIVVRRRPDDPNDTRANEPAVKTLGRDISLDPAMAELLSRYIQHHRSQCPSSIGRSVSKFRAIKAKRRVTFAETGDTAFVMESRPSLRK
jgi:hypothetical protein